MKRIVVGLGEILWDVFPESKKLGGAPANFAYHASQLGFDGYVISAIGKDALGVEILSQLSPKQLNMEIEQIDFPTGTVLVSIDDKGVPQYDISQDVAWDNIPLTEAMKDLAKCTDAVCFGTLAQRSSRSRETITKFIELVPEESLKVFDLNLRQSYYSRELIEMSLSQCNMLKINDDEAKVVSELFELNAISEVEFCKYMLSNYNLRYVILTKGENGSYAADSNQISFFESPKVNVADTVGAGDAFTAAFVCSILSGKKLVDAHMEAIKLSAFVCTQPGAMPVYLSK